MKVKKLLFKKNFNEEILLPLKTAPTETSLTLGDGLKSDNSTNRKEYEEEVSDLGAKVARDLIADGNHLHVYKRDSSSASSWGSVLGGALGASTTAGLSSGGTSTSSSKDWGTTGVDNCLV